MIMGALVPIVALAMASDVSWAVTVSHDGTVRTLGTGAVPRVLRRAVPIDGDQPVAVSLVAGRLVRVVWAAEDGLRLFENDRGAWPRNEVFAVPASITALAFAPSGRIVMLACDDGTLLRFDVITGKFGERLTTGSSPARVLAMASDDGPVAICLGDGSVYRLDLRAGNSLAVGTGLNASRVAITPDGGIVVTHGVDGLLRRWNLSWGGMPETHHLDPAITGLAVDGTGNLVLTGSADGSLWLYDLTSDSATPFGQAERSWPAASEPPPLSQPGAASHQAPPGWWAPAEGEGPSDQAAPAGGEGSPGWAAPDDVDEGPLSVIAGEGSPAPGAIIDDDVSFTVYRPRYLSPKVWASLLAFVHKTDPVVDPEQGPVDPIKEVERRAREVLGPSVPPPARADARSGLPRGARLRIAIDLPRVQCNPDEVELDWWEPIHEVKFRLQAGPELTGSVVRGAVRFWYGPLLIGEVSLAISVRAAGEPDEASVAERAPMYRKIFPSYSHLDHGIVRDFEDAARALGDQYLQDVLALRAGERWQPRLLELIAQADVFQLFWSTNSMRSQYCQQEWEHALALGRPLFVRPLYWEDPLPEDMALGLPPAGLRELHFVRVRSGSGPPGSQTGPGLTRHDTGVFAQAPPDLLVRTRRSDHHMQAGTTYSVGRDPDSDVSVTDSRVSWRHGVLRVDGQQWVFEDVGSTNGTFLGSQRLDRIAIGQDCVLRLGSLEDGPILRCMPQAAATPSPAVPEDPATGQTVIVPFEPPTPAAPAAPPPSEQDAWWQPEPQGQSAPVPHEPIPASPMPYQPAAGRAAPRGPVPQGPHNSADWQMARPVAGPRSPSGAPSRGRSPRRVVLTVAAAVIIVAAAIVAILLIGTH